MHNPLWLEDGFSHITDEGIVLFRAVRPPLAALRDTTRPFAQRHGSDPVPAAIEADARQLLADVRRLVSRERGMRPLLTLARAPDWATLLIKLELAMVALATFQEEHSDYEEEVGRVVWHDDTWLELNRERYESEKRANGL